MSVLVSVLVSVDGGVQKGAGAALKLRTNIANTEQSLFNKARENEQGAKGSMM